MENFLASLRRLPYPAQMRLWDKAAVEFGLSEFSLMENAGKAACAFLRDQFGDLASKNICLFMGSGNNGGDAACLARHLADLGASPVVFHAKPLEASKGACAGHIELARADGVAFEPIDAAAGRPNPLLERIHSLRGKPPDILVDGLLGTGFSGELKAGMRLVIDWLNELSGLAGCPVLALDVPSGLNPENGRPSPVAVRAAATVAFAAAKPGLVLPLAREWTGSVHTFEIGIPRAAASRCQAGALLLDGASLLGAPAPARESHKNSYGHVVVIGGAAGLSGAAHLACAAALRSGAGLVTAMAPSGAAWRIKNGWPEIMTFSLAEGERWPAGLDASAEAFLLKANALVLGPGMGRGPDSLEFLRAVLAMPGRPGAVLDADALTLIASEPSLFQKLTVNDILTPHPGEAASLLGLRAAQVQGDRFAALAGLCALAPAAIVLKGAGTLISQAGKEVLICPYDIPQLAIGGSGDVLSGCAGALLGLRSECGNHSLVSAAMSVITHAMAGLFLARKYPCRGARASELADALAQARVFVNGLSKDSLRKGLTPWPAWN